MDVDMDVDVWVDFNEVDEHGNTLTLTKLAAVDLSVGREVTAGDGEGNVCRARVTEVRGTVVELRLNLGTFRPGRRSKQAVSRH